MKLKIFIFILGLLTLSGCSFINENNIKESNIIDIETFLENKTNTGNIITNENTIIGTGKIILEEIKIDNKETKNNTNKTGYTGTTTKTLEEAAIEKQALQEAEIEAQALEEEFKKLIDILFEVSN